MQVRAWVRIGFGSMLMVLVGCTEDLGVCDTEAAHTVYFDGYGTAMYAGQALMVRDCQSCHSPGSTGATRRGAPAGLDFAVAPISGAEDVARLAEQWRQTHRLRHQVFFEVEKKFMPPPGHVPEVVFGTSDGAPLPAIHSKEGVQAVKNWLACGAPVVGLSVAPSEDTQSGDLCATAAPFGDCRIGRKVQAEPTWNDVYSKILTSCTGCHGAGTSFGGLDFSTSEKAYATLVGDGEGADAPPPVPRLDCSRPAMKLVKPFDPEGSVLWQSLANRRDPDSSHCASPMPSEPFPPVSEDLLDPLREWISNGAEMN